MQLVKLDERIKMRADFTPGGKVVPLLFKRGDRDVFRVKEVNASWEDRETEGRQLYFSVRVSQSDDIYQLRYRENDRTWASGSRCVVGQLQNSLVSVSSCWWISRPATRPRSSGSNSVIVNPSVGEG